MKEYLSLLDRILKEGVIKENGRDGMPNTIGISKSDIRMDLSEGFPLLTTKKMFWKGVVHELLWFLRGETNIKYLVDNKVNIWNDDAYRWYLNKCNKNGILRVASFEEFIDAIKNNIVWSNLNEPECPKDYVLGDLGKVYGHQWRNQNGVDQVGDVFDGLKNNEFSRYHIIDGWNKADMGHNTNYSDEELYKIYLNRNLINSEILDYVKNKEISFDEFKSKLKNDITFRNEYGNKLVDSEMALPPCHLLYQFIVRPLSLKERELVYLGDVAKTYAFVNGNNDFYDAENVPKYYLDINMYQRSADTVLGVPFNIASMSLLLMLVAKCNNMISGIANWIGGDTHIYLPHISVAEEQLTRKPFYLPKMNIKRDIKSLDDILQLTIDDFELVDYISHPKLKAELFVGLAKNK